MFQLLFLAAGFYGTGFSPKRLVNIDTKLDPYKPLIDQWLMDDKKATRKQRHTAKRVYVRLTKEAGGFNCSYRLVADYVKEKKKRLHLENKDKRKAPLIHYPGESQCDFGSADFYENGTKHSGKYLVLSFPYSNQGFHQLLYGENMECLLESLDAIFLAYRWSTTRNLVRQYLYHCHGDHQRRRAGTDRTVPRFLALTDYNANALKAGDSDGDREHYRHDDTIQELFREDLRSLLALPSVAFELSGMKTITTNGWGKN